MACPAGAIGCKPGENKNISRSAGAEPDSAGIMGISYFWVLPSIVPMRKLVKRVLILVVIFVVSVLVWNAMENRSFNRYVRSQNGIDMNVGINTAAPVISKNQVEINAPIDRVWQVLTGIDEWPSWQKNITQAKVEGPVAEGAVFNWKSGGLSFHSKIHTMKPQTEFGWTGKTFGASAIHNWKFEQRDSITVVHVEESLQGLFPRLFRNNFQKNLDTGMVQNLAELKAAAEKEGLFDSAQ